MWEEKLKSRIISEFTKSLNEGVGLESKSINLTFNSNKYERWILISMVDPRLNIGENKRVVAVMNPIQAGMFVDHTEKVISVINTPIIKRYQYSNIILDQYLVPSLWKATENAKMDLPYMVDAFIKQIKRNNEYLSPTMEMLNKSNFNTEFTI